MWEQSAEFCLFPMKLQCFLLLCISIFRYQISFYLVCYGVFFFVLYKMYDSDCDYDYYWSHPTDTFGLFTNPGLAWRRRAVNILRHWKYVC